MRNFNPRTPCGVRRSIMLIFRRWMIFQSTHPMRGATRCVCCFPYSDAISIHAPHAGCDAFADKSLMNDDDFNPRTPCGVRREVHALRVIGIKFQSTHPMRGATRIEPIEEVFISNFNPRTPCGVRRQSACRLCATNDFNPRTPCGVRLQTNLYRRCI